MVCLSVESTVNEVELFSETLLQYAAHKEQSENTSCWVMLGRGYIPSDLTSGFSSDCAQMASSQSLKCLSSFDLFKK